MSSSYSQAEFWKCALQVNPAGYIAYRGRDHGLSLEQYNQKLLEVALEQNIKVIGLADHGNVDGVNAIRDIMAPHGIVVFPGFEISSTEKVHFVCLFPEDTSEQQLQRYLGALGLIDPTDGVWPSNLSGSDLLKKVSDLGGFAYAAHCTDDNGVLFRKLKHVWLEPQLRACQIPGAIEDLRNDEGNAYRQILLNKTPEYRREHPVAIINARDVATPEDLANPKASCLIRMTKPCFESFRLAFQDPESRVRLNSDVESTWCSAIESLRITGGYLDGVEINFSRHLNAVIGGRGTGKSTLIECLRYGLELMPIGRQAQVQHNDVVRENFGKARARIELRVRSARMQGEKFTISRRYGESAAVRDGNGNASNFTPADLLPTVEIYGQNEIYEIARDQQGQRRLLDRFVGAHVATHRERIQEALKKLAINRKALLDARQHLSNAEDQLAKLPKLQEQLTQFRNLRLEEKLKVVPLLETEKTLLGRAVGTELKNLREAVSGVEESLPDTVFLSDAAISALPDGNQFLQIREELDGFRQRTVEMLERWKSDFAEVSSRLELQAASVIDSIAAQEAELERVFRELPAAAGKTGRQIGGEYQSLLRDIERLKPYEAAIATQRRLVEELQLQRKGLLAELSQHRAEQSAAIAKSLKPLNKKLLGKLRLAILPESDRKPVVQFLLSRKLEGVGEARLNWIPAVDSFSVSRLSELIRAGSDALRAENWGVTPSVAESLAKLSYADTLELEEIDIPDTVNIELNIEHAEQESLRPLEKLSRGQQCTAILHLLLLENVDPLIVDQPEDNLDNAFIADRIVSELRSAKLSRQFVFSTHNANIPVFGDAEWIGVLDSDGNQATMPVERQGAVDVPAIRDRAAEILEGGKEAFNQRRAKYGYDD